MNITPRFKTTKGFNAQVVIAKALQYWGTGSNTYADFCAAGAADGTFCLFNADTNVSLDENTAVAATVPVFAAVIRDGKVRKTTVFSTGTHKVEKAAYSAAALHVVTVVSPASGAPTAGKEYGILIKEITNHDMVNNANYRYSVVAATGETYATLMAKFAAKINDTTSIANQARNLIVDAAVVNTKDMTITAKGVGTLFTVSLYEEASITHTSSVTTKGKIGQGTPLQVAQLEQEGWIFEGVTTNYPKHGNPEEYGKPTSLVVSTGQYTVYTISGFVTKEGKGPINQEVDKNAIIIAADSNALDAARATDNIDIIFGFVAPV